MRCSSGLGCIDIGLMKVVMRTEMIVGMKEEGGGNGKRIETGQALLLRELQRYKD